jgi:hypothetical protein
MAGLAPQWSALLALVALVALVALGWPGGLLAGALVCWAAGWPGRGEGREVAGLESGVAAVREQVAGMVAAQGRLEARLDALEGRAFVQSSAPAASLPVGSLVPWVARLPAPSGAGRPSPDTPPPGWLPCDGQVEQRPAYCDHKYSGHFLRPSVRFVQVIEEGGWRGLETPHANSEEVRQPGVTVARGNR